MENSVQREANPQGKGREIFVAGKQQGKDPLPENTDGQIVTSHIVND